MALSSFRTQLWGAAFGSNFGEQLSGAVLENSFGKPLWGTGLKRSCFGATALQRCFGEQLWKAAAGNPFGEQLWGVALASFSEQLCRTIALKNSRFGEQLYRQLRRAAFRSNLGAQLSGAALQNSFVEPFWRTGLQNRSFGATALEHSFGAQLWGAPGNSFGEQL